MKLAISLFPNQTAAEEAVAELSKMGFDSDDLEIFTHDRIDSAPDSHMVLAAGTAAAATDGIAGYNSPSGSEIIVGAPTARLFHATIRTFLESHGVRGSDLEFYDRGLRGDGALVIVTARHHDDLRRAEGALADLGGKTEEERI